MNILILTGKFGLGHYKAAMAVKEELIKEKRVDKVEIVDIMEYLAPKISNHIYHGFEKLVSGRADLYNVICKTTAKYTSAPFKRAFARNMKRLLESHEANIVVSTLPMCSQYIGAYKKQRGDQIPLITYITDISSKDEWITDCTDIYVVATAGVKEELVEKGIPEEKVKVGGIPVGEAFRRGENVKCKDFHAKLSILQEKRRKEVLIMGGGLGLIPNAEELLTRLNAEEDLHTTIITGTNEALCAKLKGQYKNISVLGYTENVADYMKRADVLISKPGGITMFEAINCGTPIFSIKPFLDQEINNASFIQANKIGQIQWDDSVSAFDCLMSLVSDGEKLAHMSRNMARLCTQRDDTSVLEAVAC